MNPQQYPGAPPAPTPQPTDQNPYDFIINSGTPQPKGKFNLPQGKSPLQRVLIIAAGIVLLLVVFMVVATIFSGNGSRNKELLAVAQDQTEIIRIADLAKSEKSVRLASTKDLAVNTSLALTSAKVQTVALIKGKKAGDKQLGLTKSSKTDSTLATAAANNQYDAKFVEILTAKLKAYQTKVKAAYSGAKTAKEKQVLQDAFNGATLLIGEKVSS